VKSSAGPRIAFAAARKTAHGKAKNSNNYDKFMCSKFHRFSFVIEKTRQKYFYSSSIVLFKIIFLGLYAQMKTITLGLIALCLLLQAPIYGKKN